MGTTQRHEDQGQFHPLSRVALFRQVGPLVAGALLGLLALASRQVEPAQAGLLTQAAAIAALTVAGTMFIPWNRLPRSAEIIPPLALLLVAFLVREATGGASSLYAQLALLPVLWMGAYAAAAELALGLVVATGVLLLPVAVPGSTSNDVTRGLLLAAAAIVLGIAEQRFFSGLRSHTDRLRLLAHVDPLTGAINRRGWEQEMDRARSRADRTSGPLCVAILDLDHFKEYNDAHGHQAGDRFLKEVTAAWRGSLRDTDVLARLGGDEFAILLPDCPLEAAERIIGRLGTGLPPGCTFSAGVATWDHQETPAELVARADQALYAAKESGRGRTLVAAPRGAVILPDLGETSTGLTL